VRISIFPDLRRPLVPPPQRDPIPFSPRQPPGGYASVIDVTGTAHFTMRSIIDAMERASSGDYSAVAIELDRGRFDELSVASYYADPLYRPAVEGEFVAAADAFGNRDGDIWLIDMTMDEIRSRIASGLRPGELRSWAVASRELGRYERLGMRYWEAGMKEEAMRFLGATTRAMEEYSPTIHRVLIEERNALMAARLVEVAGRTDGRILALVGMAHVPGVTGLLSRPEAIGRQLERYGLNYSPPTRIRRARVN
jgi:pheromone shutdown protein TraB